MNFSEIPGFEFATILETPVTPYTQTNVYHGTSKVDAKQCEDQGGLPMRGRDIDLIRHAEPPASRLEPSAFIGTCAFPKAPGYDAGAVEWAGEGGWVYHIDSWPGYDLNALLEGKIPDGKGGFRGPLNVAEQEIAIPAHVPRDKIVKYGRVERLRGGLAIRWENS